MKRTRFTQLPPVLNLQLIRFDYDAESGQKKKLNDRIFIPYRLNMADYCSPSAASSHSPSSPPPPAMEYVLTAVLRHKGSSAHRGHYTCEVQDAKGQWWIFDDDKVGLGGSHFNARGDTAAAKVAKVAAFAADEEKTAEGKKKRKKAPLTLKKRVKRATVDEGQGRMTDHFAERKVEEAVDDDEVQVLEDDDSPERVEEEVVVEESREPAGQQKGVDGDYSTNAYQLQYTLASRHQAISIAASQASAQLKRGASGADERKESPSPSSAMGTVEPPTFVCDCHSSCSPPPSVKEAIEASVHQLSTDIARYEVRKAQLMERITQRKKEVEELLDELDGPLITERSAAKYQRQLLHPMASASPHMRSAQGRHEVLMVDDDIDDDDEEDSAEPFRFIHVGWLQRWLTGQTERECSDAQAEKVGKGEVPAKATAVGVGGEGRSDAIVLDDDEDSGELRRSPSASEAIVLTDEEKADDDDPQVSANSVSPPPTASSASPASLISPRNVDSSPRQSSSSSPSSLMRPPSLDDDDPLSPGDLYDSLNRLRCVHGRLDPAQHNRARTKRISCDAWSKLKAQYLTSRDARSTFLVNAGLPPLPAITDSDLHEGSLCTDCVVRLKATEHALQSQRMEFDDLIERMKEFTSPAGKSAGAFHSGELSQHGYLLDRQWYKELVERIKRHKLKMYSAVPLQPGGIEDINAGLQCSHGLVVLNRQDRAYLISADLWLEDFKRLWPNSTDISAIEPDCDICAAVDEQDMAEREQLKTVLEEEQAISGMKKFLSPTFHETFPDKKRPLRPGIRYFLLPTRWVMNKFLPYQNQAVVNTALPLLRDRPGPVPVAELLCKHGLLRCNPVPIDLIEKSLNTMLPGIKPGDVTVCEASSWAALQRLGYAEKESKEGQVTQVCMDVSLESKEKGSPEDEALQWHGWENLTLTCSPEPCVECIKEQQMDELSRLHHFVEGRLLIKRVSKLVPLGTASSAQTSSTSTRSRRKRSVAALEEFTAYGISHWDDVSIVKMKVSQYTSCSPAHMRLFFNDEELKEGKKLSDYRVTNGAELLLKVDVDSGDRDFMDYLPNDDAVFASGDVESGFAGTRLGGEKPVGSVEARRAQSTASPASGSSKPSLSLGTYSPLAPLLPRLVDTPPSSSSSTSPSVLSPPQRPTPPPPKSSFMALVGSHLSMESGRSASRTPPMSPAQAGEWQHIPAHLLAPDEQLRQQRARDEEASFRVARELQDEEDRRDAQRRQQREQDDARSADLLDIERGERIASQKAREAGMDLDEGDDGDYDDAGGDSHDSDGDYSGSDDAKSGGRKKKAKGKGAKAAKPRSRATKAAAKDADPDTGSAAKRKRQSTRARVQTERKAHMASDEDEEESEDEGEERDEREEKEAEAPAGGRQPKSKVNWMTGERKEARDPLSLPFTCSICTLNNEAGRARCSACDTPRQTIVPSGSSR